MGMPKRLRLMETQARKVLCSRFLDLTSRHIAKSGEDQPRKIHSQSTFRIYSRALGKAGTWCRQKYNLLFIAKMTPEMASAYLEHRRSQDIGQKQLDNDRNAMGFMVGDLARVKALGEAPKESRAYSRDEAERIAARQAPHNALATRIAYDAGLRAHELHTLRRTDEASASPHRAWRPDRFLGRRGVCYVVTGKGGLLREVMLSHGLSMALEARRLAEPRPVTDRGIHYQSHYDIGGGMAFSKSFTTCSKRELGFSHGAHGVRHSYAQSRFATLLARGLSDDHAKDILCQELGHFRREIVDEYLR